MEQNNIEGNTQSNAIIDLKTRPGSITVEIQAYHEALEWMVDRTEKLAAGIPVGDLDECLVRAHSVLQVYGRK